MVGRDSYLIPHYNARPRLVSPFHFFPTLPGRSVAAIFASGSHASGQRPRGTDDHSRGVGPVHGNGDRRPRLAQALAGLDVGDRAAGRETQPPHVEDQPGIARFGIIALKHEHDSPVSLGDQRQPAQTGGTLHHRIVAPVVLHAAGGQAVAEVPDCLFQAAGRLGGRHAPERIAPARDLVHHAHSPFHADERFRPHAGLLVHDRLLQVPRQGNDQVGVAADLASDGLREQEVRIHRRRLGHPFQVAQLIDPGVQRQDLGVGDMVA